LLKTKIYNAAGPLTTARSILPAPETILETTSTSAIMQTAVDSVTMQTDFVLLSINNSHYPCYTDYSS
jgi:hypothetical protein